MDNIAARVGTSFSIHLIIHTFFSEIQFNLMRGKFDGAKFYQCGDQHIDRMEEARAAAAEVLRINPKLTVSHWAKAAPFKDPTVLKHRNKLMRKAGLP